MYQSNIDTFTEEDFKELTEGFEENVCKDLNIDSQEWDITKLYTPNWACIWNSKDNIGEKCKIVQKNSKLALVTFIDKDKTYADIFGNNNLLERMYRLEDLSMIK